MIEARSKNWTPKFIALAVVCFLIGTGLLGYHYFLKPEVGPSDRQSVKAVPTKELKQTSVQEIPNAEIIKFATNKKTYGSYEEMKISVIVRSSKNFQAKVNVSGIKPHSHAYINDSRLVNLTTGENEITFFEKTPHCTSGCGGVYPGPYDLNVEIFVKETLVADSITTINLVSD